ncbi:MAG: hypothetical protein ACLTIG_15225 [Roseburia hominis]
MQSILIAIGKLIFSIVLVILGWKVYGIIAAILIGTLLAIVYGMRYMKKYVWSGKARVAEHGIDLKEFMHYSIGTIVAQGCVIALTNGDILLVKAYFNDTEASTLFLSIGTWKDCHVCIYSDCSDTFSYGG